MEKQIKSIDLIMENTEFIHIPTEAINSLYFEKTNTIVALYDDNSSHTKKTSISTEINNLIFNVNLDKLIKLTTVADHELFNVAYENKEYTVKALNDLILLDSKFHTMTYLKKHYSLNGRVNQTTITKIIIILKLTKTLCN